MADYPPELITFLMEKHGGEAQVLKAFAHEKIRKNISDLADAGGSLSDLLQEASDQGFREALEKIELKELARLITGKQLLPAISSASGQAQHKRLRLSDAERAQLHEQMLAFIGDNPWSMNAEITRAVGYDTKRIGFHLRELKDQGILTSSGSRTNMRYALAEETSEPATN